MRAISVKQGHCIDLPYSMSCKEKQQKSSLQLGIVWETQVLGRTNRESGKPVDSPRRKRPWTKCKGDECPFKPLELLARAAA